MNKTLIVLGSALLVAAIAGCDKKPTSAPTQSAAPATQSAEIKPADAAAPAAGATTATATPAPSPAAAGGEPATAPANAPAPAK